VPLEIAHKVVLSAYLIGFPLAVLALARALGRSPWLAMGAFVLAYGPSVNYGYEAYLLGAALFFLALAALVRYGDLGGRGRLAWLAAVLTLLYLAHALPWGLALAIVALVQWRALVAAAPSLALAAIAFVQEQAEHAYVKEAPFRATWREPWTAMAELPRWTLEIFPGPLDMVLLGGVAVTVIALCMLQGARPRTPHGTAIAAVVAAYFTAPFEVSQPVIFFMISARLPLLLGPLLLLLPQGRVLGKARLALVPLVLAAAVLPLQLTRLYRDFDRRYAPFLALVETIPMGKTTFVARRQLMPPPLPAESSGDPASSAPVYWTESAWPVVLRGGYSPYLFDQGFPVVYTKRLVAPPFPPRDGVEPREAPEFDYYLLREPSDEARRDPAVVRVGEADKWELFRRVRAR